MTVSAPRRPVPAKRPARRGALVYPCGVCSRGRDSDVCGVLIRPECRNRRGHILRPPSLYMAIICRCLLLLAPKWYIGGFLMSRDYGGGSPGFIPKIRPWDSKSLQRTDATPRSSSSGRRKFRFANCFRAHFGLGEPRLCSPKTRPRTPAPTGLGRRLLHLIMGTIEWKRVGWRGALPVSARPQTEETAAPAHCGPWSGPLKFRW